MSFPKILVQTWVMDSADLCEVGEYLGYDWSCVAQEIQEKEFYPMDGEGVLDISRGVEVENSPILTHIISSIFENYPDVNEIVIAS